jgi:hypothetical protein
MRITDYGLGGRIKELKAEGMGLERLDAAGNK